MTELTKPPDTVVVGAAGFLGRWTVLELLRRGRTVAAVMREPSRHPNGDKMSRAARLRAWLAEHGAATEGLEIVAGDTTAGAGLGLGAGADERMAEVREVYNTAAVYRFGLRREQARHSNVDGAVNVLRWAATRPKLRRLIHVSGYRVGLSGQPRYPMPDSERDRLYRDKGAYEGSKAEADEAVRAMAEEQGVPLTVVNPATVIGHGTTGETGQYLGLAELARDLWQGRLPVLPGTAKTFVPVVTVDYFARFMAAIPEHDPVPGGRHWLLDDNTPALPELVRLLAEHLGVRGPRARVPAGVIRTLPAAITGADPETLTFLSEDRYDTGSADKVAAAAGLKHPVVEAALRRWADRLVADGFGTAPAGLPGGFADVAGSRSYVAGDGVNPDFVLLHGLPLDGESWRPVLGELDDDAGLDPAGSTVLVADLPGLGRSAPASGSHVDWLTGLLAPIRTRPVIVAHSAATAIALRYAATWPERVGALLLVSPYFLQEPTAWPLRVPALTVPVLKRISPDRLAAQLGISGSDPNEATRAIGSAVAGLRRPGGARRIARRLKNGGRAAERGELRALLGQVTIPVHIVHGERDPLIEDPGPVPV
ncbi:MAG: alpha/beta fold hydrolase, partial [Stackebrandtia sp.]